MFCCVPGNTALLSYCVCILNMQLKNHKSGKPHEEEIVDVVMVSHMHTAPLYLSANQRYKHYATKPVCY